MISDAQNIHDRYNPYTAAQRSPSQEYVVAPDAEPLQSDFPVFYNSNDAVINLKSIQSCATSTIDTMQSRSIVPNVINPVYASNSDVDTRSAGNPYGHHPNFTTPSQYFNHVLDEQAKSSISESQLLTIADTAQLPDPFTQNCTPNFYPPIVRPPNDVTINKLALSSKSLEELNQLNFEFPLRNAPVNSKYIIPRENETLNKKLLSPESMYELSKINVVFEEKMSASNLMKLRDFSLQSLEDLRELRNFSQYTDFNYGPSQDVSTCLGITPREHEIAEFQYYENVQYGGI